VLEAEIEEPAALVVEEPVEVEAIQTQPEFVPEEALVEATQSSSDDLNFDEIDESISSLRLTLGSLREHFPTPSEDSERAA
jgi:hypothetical protein